MFGLLFFAAIVILERTYFIFAQHLYPYNTGLQWPYNFIYSAAIGIKIA